jgi:hypothetical protein
VSRWLGGLGSGRAVFLIVRFQEVVFLLLHHLAVVVEIGPEEDVGP